MPVAGWFTWQAECIEGKGVEPAFVVENSPESLASGGDVQSQKALEIVKTLWLASQGSHQEKDEVGCHFSAMRLILRMQNAGSRASLDIAHG